MTEKISNKDSDEEEIDLSCQGEFCIPNTMHTMNVFMPQSISKIIN